MSQIREAQIADFDAIWPIFSEVTRQGDTYGYSTSTDKATAFDLWMKAPLKTFVFEDNGRILGTYYLKPNQAGPGSHVCNCGYMVASEARGQGIASKMCEHSQVIARELGYRAMQFNFVASTNEGAVRLWQKLGFKIVGTLPGAFNHPQQGYVNALVMYKCLDRENDFNG